MIKTIWSNEEEETREEFLNFELGQLEHQLVTDIQVYTDHIWDYLHGNRNMPAKRYDAKTALLDAYAGYLNTMWDDDLEEWEEMMAYYQDNPNIIEEWKETKIDSSSKILNKVHKRISVLIFKYWNIEIRWLSSKQWIRNIIHAFGSEEFKDLHDEFIERELDQIRNLY